MSFSKAFERGSAVAGSWIDDYKQSKTEDIENKAYEKKFELQEKERRNRAEGDALQAETDEFVSMDGNALSSTIMRGIVAEGGKVDDQTWKVMDRLGMEWDSQKLKRSEYQRKNELFQKEKGVWDNYFSTVGDAVKTREKKEEITHDPTGGSSWMSKYKMKNVQPAKDYARGGKGYQAEAKSIAESVGIVPRKDGSYSEANMKRISSLASEHSVNAETFAGRGKTYVAPTGNSKDSTTKQYKEIKVVKGVEWGRNSSKEDWTEIIKKK